MIYHYYLSANSAQGYVDLTEQRIAQLTHITHTIGYPAALLQNIAGTAMLRAQAQKLRLDIVHRPLDDGIAGLILPERGTAIFNTPLWLDQSRHVANLYESGTRDNIQELLTAVWGDYAIAKQVHDKLEQIYIAETDFSQLDTLAQTYIDLLIGEESTAQPGLRTDAFLGTATPDGPVDYIACLTAELKHRFFMKGRPGTGKSTFLKKIAYAAQRAGYAVEIYRCSFDTDSLDMLIVRDKSFCIFDSTAPHEHFPVRVGDEILDLYAAAVRRETDERSIAQRGTLEKQYRQITARATQRLEQIHQLVADIHTEAVRPLSTLRVSATMEVLINGLFEPK